MAKSETREQRKGQGKQKSEKKGFFARVATFFSDLKSELKLVVWPSKEKLKQSSAIVFLVIIACAALIFVVDTVVNQSLTAVGFYDQKPRVVTQQTAEPSPAPSETTKG